tara:strand:+ start:12302 stop:12679 length:378 start_codon:yes stop_codon:yes gene_type:complete
MSYVVRIRLDNINDSASVGDTVYYTSAALVGSVTNNFLVNQNSYSDIITFGTIRAVNHTQGYIDVEGSANVDLPSSNSYIFFSKNNLINQGFVKGYYAELKMVNTDFINKSELFRISLAADESSK